MTEIKANSFPFLNKSSTLNNVPRPKFPFFGKWRLNFGNSSYTSFVNLIVEIFLFRILDLTQNNPNIHPKILSLYFSQIFEAIFVHLRNVQRYNKIWNCHKRTKFNLKIPQIPKKWPQIQFADKWSDFGHYRPWWPHFQTFVF